MSRICLVLCVLPGLVAGCGCEPAQETERLRVFHAAGLTPLLEDVHEACRRDAGIALVAEGSGSQAACRKRTELGRPCDLLMLADNALVTTLLQDVCTWRLDFARDEVVLAVGLRAPEVAQAEEDWAQVLRRTGRLARVDENQGPIGYRTLLVWKLEAARRGRPELYDTLVDRCDKVVDHVSRLPPLLRRGEIDYAFVYRSICIAHDLRFIPLDPAVNLGDPDRDYTSAKVTYARLQAGPQKEVEVRGRPIVWTLTVPDREADAALAARFVRYLLREHAGALDRHGFHPLSPPRFYGPEQDFAAYEAVAEHRGPLRAPGQDP